MGLKEFLYKYPDREAVHILGAEPSMNSLFLVLSQSKFDFFSNLRLHTPIYQLPHASSPILLGVSTVELLHLSFVLL